MPAHISDSAKESILAILVISGVVVFLIVFHFILGMTWMIYVLVIAVIALIFVRKIVALKRQRAGAIAGKS
nr:hypothetical protein [Candidatus Sigynarchaeum springense]